MAITDFIESIFKRYNDQDTVLKIIEILIAAGMLVVAIISMKQSSNPTGIMYSIIPETSNGYQTLTDYPRTVNCYNISSSDSCKEYNIPTFTFSIFIGVVSGFIMAFTQYILHRKNK